MLLLLLRIRRSSTTYLRMILSATLGALWSVLVVMNEENVRFLMNVCTYTLIAWMMVKRLAIEDSFIENIKSVVIMYGVAFLISGCAYAFYYYTYAGYWVQTYILSDITLLVLMSLSVIFISVIINEIIKVRQLGQKFVMVSFFIKDIWIELRGIIDTGNVLVDPIYKSAVSIVQKNCLPIKLVQENINLFKYHIIPYRSLGCENGLLEVIVIDKMYITRGKEITCVEGALIGMSDMVLSSNGEYEVLVNNVHGI